MIDLSYQRGQDPGARDQGNEPVGLVILAVLPFVLLLWAVMTAGLLAW